VYSVAATEVRHVQAAINFARENNIRLSIKSTGAGYALGEQQPNSILIWMSNYRRYTTEGIIEDFRACGSSHGPALKVGGGETWGQVFGVLAADRRYMMSSGAAVTVGGAGGWLQGGGLGPFDRSLGLGADNVLQFEVVTADGQLKVANECSERDLYWALRGGGGGNLGVVVSQTSRVHPVANLIRLNLNWRGSSAWGAGVQANVAAQMPGTVLTPGVSVPIPWAGTTGATHNVQLTWNENDAGTGPGSKAQGGQPTAWHNAMRGALNRVTMDHRLDGYAGIGCAWPPGFICDDIYFRGNRSEFDRVYLRPMIEAMNITQISENGNVGVGDDYFYNMAEFPGGYYNYASGGTEGCGSEGLSNPAVEYACDTMGYPSANGIRQDAQTTQGQFEDTVSWVAPAKLFDPQHPDFNRVASDAFFSDPHMQSVVGHLLGGAVNDVSKTATAVSPAVRESAMEMLMPPATDIACAGVGPNCSAPNIRASLLQHVSPPAMGPIFNHDGRNLNVLTPLGQSVGMNWQQMYWIDNLPRLQSIKAHYDPHNVFTCRNCVTPQLGMGYNDEQGW
jgi:hypothetical protein